MLARLLPLVALAGTLAACGPTLAQREATAQPAIEALRAARFADARTQAGAVLKQDGANPYARLVDAVARYRDVMHGLATDIPSILLGALLTRGFSDRLLHVALESADRDLAVVDEDLARAAAFPALTLDLCLACWKVDWNRNGRVDDRDEALLEIEQDADGKRLPEGDPRRKPTFKFDHGDVLWARAMVSFQRALLNAVLAYDWSGFDAQGAMRGRANLVVKLARPERMQAARALILAGLDQADACRRAYLAETDDEREWVPNPRQKSHPLPLPVDAALYETWELVLGDLRRIVRGEEGVSVAELAQLGDHKWNEPPGGYLDLGGMLARPKDLALDFANLRERDLDKRDRVEAALAEAFGQYYRRDMKPSPLLGRLARMKGEIARGHESFERKLRYLIWLN
ncbi:MAG TPA: hypothetical protein VGQ83_36550 [Polyangia bacterium]|jgi:hypothetical protein